jgi:decaprenylphospho-beta-D-erythro-pentofuranosid-2-ulose 2-reductase
MKNVLIIGGNSDIGFSLACEFIKFGYNLILTSKNLPNLEIKKKLIENNYKCKCSIYKFDVENDNIFNLLEKIDNNINTLVFSNGYFEKPEISPHKIVNINYLKIVEICESLINNNKIQNLKSIIIFSSVAGDRGKKDNSIYSSAKAGLTAYANGLNQRLHNNEINVMNVKIGWVKTKMTSNLKLPAILCSSKEKVAKIIYKSHLKNKSNIYAPGYWRFIMFIYKLIPDFIFKILK